MLYFGYGALLDPDLLGTVAPKADFQFIAHLPETRLAFPAPDGRPSLQAAPGNTVWGAIFEVSPADGKAIAAAENSEGRKPVKDLRAVDRAGHKFDVVAFAHPSNGESFPPSTEYMAQVVKGARHWSLPTGWIAGLEDLGEDALI